jgi:hypothetical protein
MLSVIKSPFYADYHYAECGYAECGYAECGYAECGYAECNYAKCRGTGTITRLKSRLQELHKL